MGAAAARSIPARRRRNANNVIVGLVNVTNGPDPRGCHNVEPWQTGVRGSASYTIPKIDVLVSGVVRSQPEALLAGTANTTAQWQVPNSVIIHGPRVISRRCLTATGNTVVPIGHNDQRIYSGERRTQIDMRVAKVVRFGPTARVDVGVDLNNLLNTNYATQFSSTYIYNTDNTPRPSGWGTPTGIYNPRFVRLNFTVNF